MKKLSTLIALALVVTIGGVYAAWSYAQGSSASSEITREINMAQVNTSSNKGTITVTPNNFAFLVDDAGSVSGGSVNYLAKLVGTGDLSVLFTPASAGVDANLGTTGISMVATVTIAKTANAATYTGVNANGESVTVTPLKEKAGANVITITGNGVDGQTKLTAAQIISALNFNVDAQGNTVDVKLPTKTDNDNYHNVLKEYTIKIIISEAPFES